MLQVPHNWRLPAPIEIWGIHIKPIIKRWGLKLLFIFAEISVCRVGGLCRSYSCFICFRHDSVDDGDADDDDGDDHDIDDYISRATKLSLL